MASTACWSKSPFSTKIVSSAFTRSAGSAGNRWWAWFSSWSCGIRHNNIGRVSWSSFS